MRRIAPLVAVLGALMSLSVVAIGSAVAAPKGGKGDSKVGKACHVVAGGNKGNSGTYTNDVDGLNCAGSWGSSACTGSDGKDNGNCKDGAQHGGHHDRLLDAILAGQQRILTDQQTILNKLLDLGIKADTLGIKLGDVEAACLPPDLVPVAQPGTNPPNFCLTDGSGNLMVQVMNQGRTQADASTARITFSTPSGPVASDVPTPVLAGSGGFATLPPIPIPADCFLPANPFPSACNFQIVVDVAGVVAENDENNNFAAGACVPVL